VIARRGFTLLEAVIALTVLVMAAGACLELRAGALARSRALEAQQAEARRALTLIDLASADQLEGARLVDEGDASKGVVWEGEIAGTSYRLVRVSASAPNPLWSADPARYPERVEVMRYRLEMGGVERVVELPS